jgi:hypothetical protein
MCARRNAALADFFNVIRGSDYMTQFARAARSQIRNILLCTLTTLTLAACGGESGSSSAAAASADASDSVASLVSPNVGVIDRSQTADGTASTASNTAAGSTPATASTTSGSSTTTSGTGTSSGTVASTSKTTTPVRTSNGVATLDWMPPTENSDGTALTNLAGYTVYYGTSPTDLSQSVKVTNPGLSAYTLTGLASGTWYFAVTSYSADGVESTHSGTISTQI